MKKVIQLKLVSIQYSGGNIGDDIRIKIDGPEISFNGKRQIKNGTKAQWGKVIGNFVITAEKDELIQPLSIIITEEDTVFDDTQSAQIELKIDLGETKPQISTHRIKVSETRWNFKKPEAVFDVELECLAGDIRFISEQNQGFLNVVLEDGSTAGIPSFLKVQLDSVQSDRDHFTILEGILRGQKASVKHDIDGSPYLIVGDPYTKSSHLTYSLSSSELTFNGKPFKIAKQSSAFWKKGTYDIEIPDYPHKLGEQYLNIAPKAMVWFHIGHDRGDERYLHTGGYSAGCLTMTETKRWNKIYEMLIRARKGDLKSVGVLEVID